MLPCPWICQGSEHLPRLDAGNARSPIPLSWRKRKTTQTVSHTDVCRRVADDHSVQQEQGFNLSVMNPCLEIRAADIFNEVRTSGPGSTDYYQRACTDLKTAHQHNTWHAANLSCIALFAWLISHSWKYCWLIYCERKIMFIGWKNTAYKLNEQGAC